MNDRQGKHSLHRGRKNSQGSGLESALTGKVFKTAGILLILAGIGYLVVTYLSLKTIRNFFFAFLSPGEGPTGGEHSYTLHSPLSLIAFFLPGIAFLVLSFFIRNRSRFPATMAAYCGIILVFSAHFKELTYDFLVTGNVYPGFGIALAVSAILLSLSVWFSLLLKSSGLLILTTILHFLTLNLIVWGYGWHPVCLFTMMILFMAGTSYAVNRTGNTVPNLVNALLAWIYLGSFWLRKLYINDFTGFIAVYLVFSSLLYLLVLLTGLYGGTENKRRIWIWTARAILFLNTILYCGTVLYVLGKFGYSHFQAIWLLILAGLNSGLLYFSEKARIRASLTPYVLIDILLISMILPVLFREQQFYYFLAALSMLLLFFARYRKDNTVFLVSVAALTGSVIIFALKWILVFLPLSILHPPFIGLPIGIQPVFLSGLGSACLMVMMVYYYGQQVRKWKSEDLPPWFHKSTFLWLLKGLFLVSIYFVVFWLFQHLLLRLFNTGSAVLISWFVISCLYILVLLPVLKVRKSSFLHPVLVCGIILVALYPFVVDPVVTELRSMFLSGQQTVLQVFLFHYAAVVLQICVLSATGLILFRDVKIKPVISRSFVFFAYAVILFLAFSEYNHTVIGFSGVAEDVPGRTIKNARLPFSIMILVISTGAWIGSLFAKQRFARKVSMFAFIAAVLKILVYDLPGLSHVSRILILILLGIFLLIFSLFYAKIRRSSRRNAPGKQTVEES